MRPRFWETLPLDALDSEEWEALCDGCGRCCLNKLEDPDTGEIALTRIACRLLDGETCQCQHYAFRKQIVNNCIHLTGDNLNQHAHWLPQTCAYRLRSEGKPLPDWHPLVSGSPQAVHLAGISVQGWTIPEYEVHEDDWEDYIIQESQP